MKKILILLSIAISFTNCSIDDDRQSFYQEVMHIDSAELPSEFMLGEIYEISVTYTRPNGCYLFSNFVVQPEENTRRVFVIDNVYTNNACTQATEQATVSFNFEVLYDQTYVFQFYQGQVGGEDQYLIIEVPVVN